MHVQIAKTSSTPSHWHHRSHVGWAKLPDRRCTVHQHRLQATVRCSWSESSREMARLPAHARPSDPLGLANPPARPPTPRAVRRRLTLSLAPTLGRTAVRYQLPGTNLPRPTGSPHLIYSLPSFVGPSFLSIIFSSLPSPISL